MHRDTRLAEGRRVDGVEPVVVAIILVSAVWLGAKGTVTAEAAKFFVMGLPCVLAGTWLGLKLFGRIKEASFRKIVLALPFVSASRSSLLQVSINSEEVHLVC